MVRPGLRSLWVGLRGSGPGVAAPGAELLAAHPRFFSASGISGGCLAGAGAVLQVGDLINQNLPPCSPRTASCFCPSSFQLECLLVWAVVRVVLVPLEEEGGGSQAGFGSGLGSECWVALFSSCNPAPTGKPRQQQHQTQPREGLWGVNRSISDSTLPPEWFCKGSRLSGLLPLGPWCSCRTGSFSATLLGIFQGRCPPGCSVSLGRVGKELATLPRPYGNRLGGTERPLQPGPLPPSRCAAGRERRCCRLLPWLLGVGGRERTQGRARLVLVLPRFGSAPSPLSLSEEPLSAGAWLPRGSGCSARLPPPPGAEQARSPRRSDGAAWPWPCRRPRDPDPFPRVLLLGAEVLQWV